MLWLTIFTFNEDKMKKLALALSILISTAFAQYIPVTTPTACVKDGGGTSLGSGTLTVVGVDARGKAIPYRAGTSIQTTTAPVERTITNGQLASSLQLADRTTSNPLNILFTFTIKDNITKRITVYERIAVDANDTLVSGSFTEFNFCKMIPNPQTQQINYVTAPIMVTGVTQTITGNLDVIGTLTATGGVTCSGCVATAPVGAQTITQPATTAFTINRTSSDPSVLIKLRSNATDRLTFDDLGNEVTLGYIAFGTNPATTGFIRLPNNESIQARNASNGANIQLIGLDTLNNIFFYGSNFTMQSGGTFSAGLGYQIGGSAASGHYMRGNGTRYVDSTIQAADINTIAVDLTSGQTVAGLKTFTSSSGVRIADSAAPTLQYGSYKKNQILLYSHGSGISLAESYAQFDLITGGATFSVGNTLTDGTGSAANAFTATYNTDNSLAPTARYAVGLDLQSSVLHHRNAESYEVRTITSTDSLTWQDSVLLCNATSGNITVNLPALSALNYTLNSSQMGMSFFIKNISTNANTCTLDGNASETIDGSTTKVVNQNAVVKIIAVGSTGWYILSN
jgi:hypothetical protein